MASGQRISESDDVDTEQRREDHIVLNNITKEFNRGKVVAVDDIDLTIGEDEFVVLLGPSGCGKTTTLRCIAGLDRPNKGTISIAGEDVTNKKPKDRDLAFVFQSIALFPHMTVRENMRFGLDISSDISKNEKKKRIEEAANILGIEPLLDRKPTELSGGQQQRVSLGRAMVMEPAAFLLDEPFSALDANLRDQMRVEIKKLQRELETAMVFVTHDQEEAMTLGDKIVVMESGIIQQVGSPHDIFNDPQNIFVARFIGSPSTNILEGTVTRAGDRLTLSTDLFDIDLLPQQQEAYQGSIDQSVHVGIRPEYLNLTGDDPDFEAEVTVVENHGSRDAVYLTAKNKELTSVTPQQTITGPEESPVPVTIEREEIWLFDTDGDRIL